MRAACMMLALASVAGCSRANPRYGIDGDGDGGGDGDGDGTGDPVAPGTTSGIADGFGTSLGGDGGSTGTPKGTATGVDDGATTLDSATGTGGPDLCEGLREIRLSTTGVSQVPSGVRLATRSAVVFRDEPGAALVAAVFGEPADPEYHVLSQTEGPLDAWLVGGAPGGLAVVTENAGAVMLRQYGENYDLISQDPVTGAGEVTHSVLYNDGDQMVFPLLDGDAASMHAVTGEPMMAPAVAIANNVVWVAGSAGGTGVAIVYEVDFQPNCRAFHFSDYTSPGSDSPIASGACRFPTVAFDHDVGGIVAYSTGEGTTAEIRGQAIDEDANPRPIGGLASGNFLIAPGNGVGYADITRLPSGNFWVVWAFDGDLRAALLDADDPLMPLHVTPPFAVGSNVTFDKRTFSIGPHGAVTYHRSGDDAGVYVAVDCDSI